MEGLVTRPNPSTSGQRDSRSVLRSNMSTSLTGAPASRLPSLIPLSRIKEGSGTSTNR